MTRVGGAMGQRNRTEDGRLPAKFLKDYLKRAKLLEVRKNTITALGTDDASFSKWLNGKRLVPDTYRPTLFGMIFDGLETVEDQKKLLNEQLDQCTREDFVKEFLAAYKDLADLEGSKTTSKNSVSKLAKLFLASIDIPPDPNSAIQPRLSIEKRQDGGMHFSARALGVLGRGKEQALLEGFAIGDDSKFKWIQIAGVAGQGKSRLAHELAIKLEQLGWTAGFLKRADMKAFVGKKKQRKLNSWQPSQPTLIILDYIIGAEKKIGLMMNTLAKRENLQHPVRLVLVERHPWISAHASQPDSPTSPIPHSSRNRADWFAKVSKSDSGSNSDLDNSRFGSGVIELTKLERENLIAIVRDYAEMLNEDDDEKGNEKAHIAVLEDDDTIFQHLNRIDKSGRPLYAYFLADALARGSFREGWKHNELLNDVLHRDYDTRWGAHFDGVPPKLGAHHPAMYLALLSTIVRAVDTKELRRIKGWKNIDSNVLDETRCLTDRPINSGIRTETIVQGLEPDLLGSWFVLASVEDGAPIDRILNTAWNIAPNETAAFLVRVSQEFPSHAQLQTLLLDLPATQEAQQVFAAHAAEILKDLWEAEASIPNSLIQSLSDAAVSGGGAMALFEIWSKNNKHFGVIDKKAQLIKWFEQAANAGCGRAMTVLGIFCLRGIRVNKDAGKAVDWFRRGANAGDSGAMCLLGICYQQGLGVKADMVKAVLWFKRAAEAGNGLAMTLLGICYQQGYGLAKDTAKAEKLFRKGLEIGHDGAIYFLGMRYQEDLSLEENAEEAVEWFKHGAEAGDSRAMTLLGICYALAIGIKTDIEVSLSLFRKAAALGDDLAMSLLGIAYQQGIGVEKDQEKAKYWFGRASNT